MHHPFHWFPISLVPHFIGLIGPPISLVPQSNPFYPVLIGPPSHWSPNVTLVIQFSSVPISLVPQCNPGYRVGQSREIYSNSVPLSPPHWPYPKRIRPPSWPRVAVASSTQNTKFLHLGEPRRNELYNRRPQGLVSSCTIRVPEGEYII